jgi:hypothetical protein
MGASSVWRFDSHVSMGLTTPVGLRLGTSLISAVTKCHSGSPELSSLAKNRNVCFFLTNEKAIEVAIRDLKSGCLPWEYEMIDGAEYFLDFSVWSPQTTVLEFKPVDSSWETEFLYSVYVYDMVAWDFMDPETDDPPEGFTIPEGCPFEPLEFTRQDFSTEMQWKIYRDMKVYINRWLRIGLRPDEPFGGYWDFNSSAMCFMFVGSLEGLSVKEVALFAPGWEDAWHWDADGNLIHIEVDPAYEIYGISTDPRQQTMKQQIQDALPGAFR